MMAQPTRTDRPLAGRTYRRPHLHRTIAVIALAAVMGCGEHSVVDPVSRSSALQAAASPTVSEYARQHAQLPATPGVSMGTKGASTGITPSLSYAGPAGLSASFATTTNSSYTTYNDRAAFTAISRPAYDYGFEDVEATSPYLYERPNPWTTNGVTYVSGNSFGSNQIIGVGSIFNPQSNVLVGDNWTPMAGTLAADEAYTAFGVDLSVLGRRDPIDVVITTNRDSYTFDDLNAPDVSEGALFFGIAITNPGEYLTGFQFSSVSAGSGPALDNVFVGRLTAVDSTPSDSTPSDSTPSDSTPPDSTPTVPPVPANRAPVASAGGPYTAKEGAAVAMSAAASSDPDGDTLTYAWDLDNDGEYDDAAGASAEATFADNGTYPIGMRVTDSAGLSATATTQVTVDNVEPAVSVGGDATVDEGSSFARNGSFADPGDDTWRATVDYGDGTGAQTLALSGNAFGLSHTYADNGTYQVTTTVTEADPETASGSDQLVATVRNVAPTVTDFAVSGPVVFQGGTAVVAVSGVTFTDPAGLTVDAPFKTTIDCGNNTTPNASNQCTYDAVGTYTVSVTVTDKDGGVSAALKKTAHVAYDWAGFFQPVDNQPLLNTARAGSSIPVKFSLGGNQGLAIFAPGYPASKPVACHDTPTDAIETTVNSGSTTLQYDASSGQYTFTWKTETDWASTCRQLVLKLADGTYHRADFHFTR